MVFSAEEIRVRRAARSRKRYRENQQVRDVKISGAHKYDQEHRGIQRRQRAARYQKLREHYLARAALGRAIRNGSVIPGPCQVCGGNPVHAHHHNGYDKEHRLDVIWVCTEHHGLLHRKKG